MLTIHHLRWLYLVSVTVIVSVNLIPDETDTFFIPLSLRDIPLVKGDFKVHPHCILTATDLLFFLTPLTRGLRGISNVTK